MDLKKIQRSIDTENIKNEFIYKKNYLEPFNF